MNQNPRTKKQNFQSGHSGNSQVEQFHRLALQLQALLANEGFAIRVAKGEGPEKFASLSSEIQQSQLAHFQTYVQACTELQAQGDSLKESQKLVQAVVQKMGLRCHPDVIGKIKDDHIVEMYNKSNIQTFRNLNFFAVCSYSLDELISDPWWQLFRRDDEINRQIFYHGSAVLAGDRLETFCPDVPPHLLEEINSLRMYKMQMDLEYISPVYQNGNVVDQALVVESVKLLA